MASPDSESGGSSPRVSISLILNADAPPRTLPPRLPPPSLLARLDAALYEPGWYLQQQQQQQQQLQQQQSQLQQQPQQPLQPLQPQQQPPRLQFPLQQIQPLQQQQQFSPRFVAPQLHLLLLMHRPHMLPYPPQMVAEHHGYLPPQNHMPQNGHFPVVGVPMSMPSPYPVVQVANYAYLAYGAPGPVVVSPGQIPAQNKHRRFRRRYYQIHRKYNCTFAGCTKSYGLLNHLNTHIVTKKHGLRKSKADFKHAEKDDARDDDHSSSSNSTNTPATETGEKDSDAKLEPLAVDLESTGRVPYKSESSSEGVSTESTAEARIVLPPPNAHGSAPGSHPGYSLPSISAASEGSVKLPLLPSVVGPHSPSQ